MEENYRVYGYRWVILFSIVPIIVATQIFWLTLAPIASLAQAFYGVDSMAISLFSMSYMIMYILFTLPASWVIDKFGYRQSLIIGSLITAIFGVVRIFFADNFTIVLICQFAIAIGQPFLLNISTKVPSNWFPINERSIAAGILTMAQYLGFVVPMVLSPWIAQSYDIATLYRVYGSIACVSALLAIVLTKERPPALPGPEAEKEDLSPASMAKLFRNKDFGLVLVIVFISMGIFNTILTLIEAILKPRGISPDQSGIVGAVFVLAGVVGAVVLPIISDMLRRRTPLFIACIALLVPLYLGLTYVNSYPLLVVISGVAGFGIMGVAPILFQHGSEVAYPSKEGTSFGLILLMGQISGTLFIFLFETVSQKTGSIIIPMLAIVLATVIEVPFTFKMRESKILLSQRTESAQNLK